MDVLTKRQKKIFRLVVMNHFRTAVPVGSTHLVKERSLDCSAATIRKEMTVLEERGFLAQPHTSAGRVPTDKGYRHYLDYIMKQEPLDPHIRNEIENNICEARGNVKLILETASRILGVASQELGVVLTPWIAWGILDRLELIELTDNRILVVIRLRDRLVKTVVLDLPKKPSQSALNRVASILNERLSGLSLEEINTSIKSRINDVGLPEREIMTTIVDSQHLLFDFTEPLDVHTCGTQNIVGKPELSDSDNLNNFFRLIDDRQRLIGLFHRQVNKTEVYIGRENRDEKLNPFSVVTCCYRRGRDVGSLGVIGPKRMPYHKVVPLVDAMAETMSRFLS